MRYKDLQAMLVVAILSMFSGMATYAQQSAPQSTPQQDVPVTPEGKPPPAEITPDHPLKGPPLKGPTTSGAVPRSSAIGRADAKPSKGDYRRDREHHR
jgi:hypothetical protein